MTPPELPKIAHESALKKNLRKRKILYQVDGFAKDEHKSLPMGGRAAGAALSAGLNGW